MKTYNEQLRASFRWKLITTIWTTANAISHWAARQILEMTIDADRRDENS